MGDYILGDSPLDCNLFKNAAECQKMLGCLMEQIAGQGDFLKNQ